MRRLQAQGRRTAARVFPHLRRLIIEDSSIQLPALSDAQIAEFQEEVLGYYRDHGRSFPWRETWDPWAILLSEVMLQQTQTERVLPKYQEWLVHFPDPEALAKASSAEVLRLWSGLGYNRRALALQKTAVILAARGSFPSAEEDLLALPGIGAYTASAIQAFAFNRAVVVIETNIRSVYLHRFFPGMGRVSDASIAVLAKETLLREDPRNWYYALMDFGVEIKRVFGNPNIRSAHYSKQSAFADSNRRIRGLLLRELQTRESAEAEELAKALPFARERVDKALSDLKREGFVAEDKGHYRLGS